MNELFNELFGENCRAALAVAYPGQGKSLQFDRIFNGEIVKRFHPFIASSDPIIFGSD